MVIQGTNGLWLALHGLIGLILQLCGCAQALGCQGGPGLGPVPHQLDCHLYPVAPSGQGGTPKCYYFLFPDALCTPK